MLRRSDFASHFTQPVRRCQSGWMFVTRGACRSRRSSAGRLLISRRYRSGVGGSLLDCYFLVVTREGWTPQPSTARNPVTADVDSLQLAMQCRPCRNPGRLNFASVFHSCGFRWLHANRGSAERWKRQKVSRCFEKFVWPDDRQNFEMGVYSAWPVLVNAEIGCFSQGS